MTDRSPSAGVARLREFYCDRASLGFAYSGKGDSAEWDARMKRRAAETVALLDTLTPPSAQPRDAGEVERAFRAGWDHAQEQGLRGSVDACWDHYAHDRAALSAPASPSVETVTIPRELDDHHPLLDAIQAAWNEGEGFLGQYGARQIWAAIIHDYGSR